MKPLEDDDEATERTGLVSGQQRVPDPCRGPWKRAVLIVVLAAAVIVPLTVLVQRANNHTVAPPPPPPSVISEKSVANTSVRVMEKKKKKSKAVCNDPTQTLQLLHEKRMSKLFGRAEKKYETSSVTLVEGQGAYAICDSSWSLYQFGTDLHSSTTRLLEERVKDPKTVDKEDSGYEGISYLDGPFTWYVNPSCINAATTTP